MFTIGASELSLGLPSAFGVIGGIVAIWAALRRFTNQWVATFCAIVLPLLSGQVRNNTCEARCYALYFAVYCTAVALYLRCAAKQRRASFFYVGVAFVHGVLVAVHYVGGTFSAVLVVAALLSWRLSGDIKFLRYGLSAGTGWLAVLPSPTGPLHLFLLIKDVRRVAGLCLLSWCWGCDADGPNGGSRSSRAPPMSEIRDAWNTLTC